MIQKGMILAAGLGTRLSPITNSIPKPLVPVLNLPNIVHAIHLLKRSGVKEIVINLHHLAEQIREYLGSGDRFGVRIHYSIENELLGTGGGVKKAEHLFCGDPIVIVNCDFICDFDLYAALKRHFERKAVATMILTKTKESYTPVYFDDQGHLTGIGNGSGPFATFTGIHVLSSSALSLLRPAFSGINHDLYPTLAQSRGAYVDFVRGFWLDTGDTRAIFESSLQLLDRLPSSGVLRESITRNLDYCETEPNVWIPSGKKIGEGVVIRGPSVIGSPELLSKGASITRAVLSPETIIDGACVIENVIALGINTVTKDMNNVLLFESKGQRP